MPLPPRRIALWVLVALALSGCSPLRPKGKSPLAPTQMSADSVVLEIFFVRFPFADSEVNDRLWQEVDEQHFPPQLRNCLARNGFRIGVVGGQLPMALSELLELADKRPRAVAPNETELAKLETEPRVLRRHLQIRGGQRGEIVASGVYGSLPVLISEQGQLCGATYSRAQGVFALRPSLERDGRVLLELTPELHHDEPRQRWVGDQGAFRLEASRPRRVFSDLATSATLAPGMALLISSLPNRPGSLGHHFLTDNSGRLEQKLLVIRLAQTQHDELFSLRETLRVADSDEKSPRVASEGAEQPVDPGGGLK